GQGDPGRLVGQRPAALRPGRRRLARPGPPGGGALPARVRASGAGRRRGGTAAAARRGPRRVRRTGRAARPYPPGAAPALGTPGHPWTPLRRRADRAGARGAAPRRPTGTDPTARGAAAFAR